MKTYIFTLILLLSSFSFLQAQKKINVEENPSKTTFKNVVKSDHSAQQNKRESNEFKTTFSSKEKYGERFNKVSTKSKVNTKELPAQLALPEIIKAIEKKVAFLKKEHPNNTKDLVQLEKLLEDKKIEHALNQN